MESKSDLNDSGEEKYCWSIRHLNVASLLNMMNWKDCRSSSAINWLSLDSLLMILERRREGATKRLRVFAKRITESVLRLQKKVALPKDPHRIRFLSGSVIKMK